jgi:hypothetical protein
LPSAHHGRVVSVDELLGVRVVALEVRKPVSKELPDAVMAAIDAGRLAAKWLWSHTIAGS